MEGINANTSFYPHVILMDKEGRKVEVPYETYKAETGKTIDGLERTPGTDTVSFSSNDKTVDKPENTKKEASTAKKVGVGIASACIPGLGQAINGEWGKALGFFAGSLGSAFTLGAICPPLGLAAGLGIGIYSIVDAVKNAKA